MKISYTALSSDLRAPGDRRRFSGVATASGIHFEAGQRYPKGYDVVVLTLGADLSRVRHIKRNNRRLLFDLSDSYWMEDKADFKNRFRGIYKFVRGRYSRPVFNFSQMLVETIASCDAVTCSSPEQAEALRDYNPNITIIPDWLDEIDETAFDEHRLPSGGPADLDPSSLVLLWEGQPENLNHFTDVEDSLNRLSKRMDLRLLLVTKDRYSPFGGAPFSLPSSRLLKTLQFPFEIFDWSPANLFFASRVADLAIVPLRESDPFAWAKPENKVLSFWRLGVPVLASGTPSYSRIFQAIGAEGLVNASKSWDAYFENLATTEQALQKQVLFGQEFAREVTGLPRLRTLWSNVLEGLAT